MSNPTLQYKKESTVAVTENAKRLFQVVYKEANKDEEEESNVPVVRVSSLISKMAFYYEKLRNYVDYKEEHLMRKNAILRILKRQIVIEGVLREQESEEIAKHLIVELIRAGYLPNNKVPEVKIVEIAEVINKYLKLKKYSLASLNKLINDYKERVNLVNWIIALAACDIEERLVHNRVEKVILNSAFEILTTRLRLPENSPYEADKELQVYISIDRNFMKFDQEMISFVVFKYYNNWTNATELEIKAIGENILALRQAIDKQVNHPLAGQLNKIVIRYSVYFSVLAGVIKKNPVAVYENLKSDIKSFPRDIKEVCKKKYAQAQSRLWRAGMRSIIYIFLTKSVFAVLLEVPATIWFGDKVNYFFLGVNASFPAILLFLIILFTSIPSDKNTEKIIEGINEIVFEDKKNKEPINLREAVKRGGVINGVFGFIYFITFFVSFGFIVWGLNKIGFNFVSIVIFLFFLAFVSFFAIRIRRDTKELVVVEAKENIIIFVCDFFSVPIIAVGKWLSEKFSKINVFVFILDFIIEAPFKIFVEVAEEWTKYVKERKDEIS